MGLTTIIGNDQSSIFDILNHLLQIDMSLLESQLNVIWPIMLNVSDINELRNSN